MEANIVDPWKIDYHVKSEYGRWDGSSWINDAVTSPCVDGGYILSDFSNEPNPNGGRANIGVYGNTSEASKSLATAIGSTLDDNLIIYPNPTSTKVFVNKDFIECRYEITSITGAIVKRGKIKTDNIDLSKLDTGVYIIKIFETQSDRVNVAKIIKE